MAKNGLLVANGAYLVVCQWLITGELMVYDQLMVNSGSSMNYHH